MGSAFTLAASTHSRIRVPTMEEDEVVDLSFWFWVSEFWVWVVVELRVVLERRPWWTNTKNSVSGKNLKNDVSGS